MTLRQGQGQSSNPNRTENGDSSPRLLITYGARWKVSLHLGGIAGSIAVFVLLFGPVLLVLSPLVALVGWWRWRVGAHTVAQAVVEDTWRCGC